MCGSLLNSSNAMRCSRLKYRKFFSKQSTIIFCSEKGSWKDKLKWKNIIMCSISYINASLVFVILMILMVSIMGLLPDILNFFRPLNESRAHYLLFMNEYHVNEGILFYSFFLYSTISIIIGTFSVLSIGSMLLLTSLHCCAIFKICR